MTGLSAVNSASKSASLEPVRVLGLRLQLHEVDDVDDADLKVGQVLAQDRDRGKRLERRHVARSRP